VFQSVNRCNVASIKLVQAYPNITLQVGRPHSPNIVTAGPYQIRPCASCTVCLCFRPLSSCATGSYTFSQAEGCLQVTNVMVQRGIHVMSKPHTWQGAAGHSPARMCTMPVA
jgi:hypothetical protein